MSCSIAVEIDYTKGPAPNWPDLKIEIQHGSQEAITRLCEEHGGGKNSVACAVVSFVYRTCTIYIPKQHVIYDRILVHEKAHCRGYDHYGSTVLRDAWKKYQQGMRRF